MKDFRILEGVRENLPHGSAQPGVFYRTTDREGWYLGEEDGSLTTLMEAGEGDGSSVTGLDTDSYGDYGTAEGVYSVSGTRIFTNLHATTVANGALIEWGNTGFDFSEQIAEIRELLDSGTVLEVTCISYLNTGKTYPYDFCGKIVELATGDIGFYVEGLPNAVLAIDGSTADYFDMFICGYPQFGDDVYGHGAHAEGYSSAAQGMYSHAEGDMAKASGKYSHAEGRDTKAAYSAHAEGSTTFAHGKYTHTEGWQTTAWNGECAHAEGRRTTTAGYGAHAEGYSSMRAVEAAKAYNEAHGTTIDITTATDDEILMLYNYAYEDTSGTGSKFTLAKGESARATGRNTLALGKNSIAGGHETKALGEASLATGYGTVARGKASTATGSYTQAISENSHAEGNQTIAGDLATGGSNHAEGCLTCARGTYSHAEGLGSESLGVISHAEGNHTIAGGTYNSSTNKYEVGGAGYSHAEGDYTWAKGQATHAAGVGTIASTPGSTVVGTFNNTTANALFIVGNGTGDRRGVAHGPYYDISRSNAFEVLKNGTVNGYGDLNISGIASIGGDIKSNGDLSIEGNAVITGHLDAGSINFNADAALLANESTGDAGTVVLASQSQAKIVGSTVLGRSTATLEEIIALYNQAKNKNYSVDTLTEAQTQEIFEYELAKPGTHLTNVAYGNAHGPAFVVGDNCLAWGAGAYSEGTRTQATEYSHAEGYETRARGKFGAHAEGKQTWAKGNSSHAQGEGSQATGLCAFAGGYHTISSGHSSFATGYLTKAAGQGAFAAGSNTETNGAAAVALGIKTYAAGNGAHSFGYAHKTPDELIAAYNTANNTALTISAANIQLAYSYFMTNNQKSSLSCVAWGEAALASGTNCLANGINAHAEGCRTQATAYSHTEGFEARATAQCSHAEGHTTLTSGYAAHAEGQKTTASGAQSHAEGSNTIASGAQSHAGGLGTIASKVAQTAIGKYNAESANALFIVGNGTGTATSARKNAFEVISDSTGVSLKVGKVTITEAQLQALLDNMVVIASGTDEITEGETELAANSYYFTYEE